MAEVSTSKRLLSLIVLATLPIGYTSCRYNSVESNESNKPAVKNVTVTDEAQQQRLQNLRHKVIRQVKKSPDPYSNLKLLDTFAKLTDANSSVTAAQAEIKKYQKQKLAAGSEANSKDQKPLLKR